MRMPIFGKKKATRTIFGATGTAVEKDINTATNFKTYVDEDPVLNANLKTLNDAVFEHYPKLKKTEESISDELIEKRNEELNKVDFGRKVKDANPNLWHNGNIFFEVVVRGNSLKEFYIIDPDTMKVEEDDYGNVIKYIQKQPSGDKVIPKERIFHIKAPSLRAGTVGKPLLLPLQYTLPRKREAENYMAGMINNLHPLLYVQMTNADDHIAKEIQNEVRRPREPTDPIKLIALLPGEEVGRVDTGSTDNFEAIHRYIDAQNDEIIRVVQIPPIVSGSVDNSNRSNSEVQERAVFGRTTVAWQNFYKREYERFFREKLGWTGSELEFPMSDDRKLEAVLVRATKLKELGYTNSSIHEFIENEGIKITPEFEQELNKSLVDIDNAPSRQPRDKGGIPQNEEERQRDIQNGTKKQAQ